MEDNKREIKTTDVFAAQEVICKTCHIKNCDNCPVTDIMMRARITHLEGICSEFGKYQYDTNCRLVKLEDNLSRLINELREVKNSGYFSGILTPDVSLPFVSNEIKSFKQNVEDTHKKSIQDIKNAPVVTMEELEGNDEESLPELEKPSIDKLIENAPVVTMEELENSVEEKPKAKVKPKAVLRKEEPKEHPKFKKTSNPDEDLQNWIQERYDFVDDKIKYYKLEETRSKIFKYCLIKMRDVYGFVVDQERKDFKYNNLTDDRYITTTMELIYNSIGFKSIFENLLHDYVLDLCKDKVPVSPEPKKKETDKKLRKPYQKRHPKYKEFYQMYQLSVQELQKVTGDNIQLVGKGALNYTRLILEKDDLDVKTVCSDEDLLNKFVAITDKLINSEDLWIKVKTAMGHNFQYFKNNFKK